MAWIEAQSTPVIAVLMFGVCYVLAAAIFGVSAILSGRKVAADLKAVSPVTLTPLGVILGLLVAFLSYQVWGNLDRAREYVGKEAGALRETALLTDALPPEVRTRVRQAILKHVDLVETQEWPAMAAGRATLQAVPVGLAEAMTALLSFTPTQPSQQLAQRRALVAIEQAFEARRGRIRLSQTEIEPVQWAVIIVLAVLIMVTIAIIHIDNALAKATALFIFSTASAVCLVLLVVYDRPFGAGGHTVSPTLFRHVVPD